VKPPNIMPDEAGKTRLMDFGLVKREGGEITMTVEGQLLGTSAFTRGFAGAICKRVGARRSLYCRARGNCPYP